MKKKKQASEEYTGLRCPKCRAPVPAGAGRCTRCNTLLDPDTGQARTRLTDVDMLELVEASRRARTKGIVKTVIGLLIMALAILLMGDTDGGFLYSAGVVVIVIGGGVLCTGLITLKEYKGHIKEQLSRSVVPQVLSEVFDEVEYDAYRHISPEVIYASGAFPFGFDKASGGDYIKASYRGVGLELCDLMLEEEVRTTSTDSDGNSTSDTSNRIVFVGQWLILDFHKELSADLGVYEGLRKRYDQIETENAEFNKRYGISCDSVHDAFYILTPNMMEHIMAMDRRAGGKVYLRFLREGKIHVAVNSRRDHFEVGSLNDADLPSLRMKFRGEVRYVTELIDALLTVDTLYKQ